MTAWGIQTSHAVADLQAQDWDAMLVMVRQHRLGPLLHWRLGQTGSNSQVPPPFAAAIAASFHKHAWRSLELQREIVRTQRTLAGCGISPVFLKGAFVAFHTYPHAALRPMRDVDLLVRAEQAMDGYEALLGAGFARDRAHPGNPAAAIAHLKHLPPLLSPSGRVTIELHTRLTQPAAGAAVRRVDPAERPETWSRLIYRDIGGERIGYLSPSDQLLHLIVHAIYDHRLNCGPLILTDIAQLLAHADIEWPEFWRMAAAGRWVPGCWWLLNLTRHFYRELRFTAPAAVPPQLPADLIYIAATLMLGNACERVNLTLKSDLLRADSAFARLRVLVGRVRPPPTQKSYLAHWWRLSTVRMPEYLASWSDTGGARESRVAARLRSWLGE